VNRLYPVRVPGLTKVFAIEAGGHFSLALSYGGNVFACGWNGWGQLGTGDYTDRSTFAQVVLDGNIPFCNQIALAAGDGHVLSLDYSGTIRAWGFNAFGQLGFGDDITRNRPTRQPGTLASSIACGGYHSVHVNALSEVFECGLNESGQLGLGSNDNQYSW